MDCMQGLYTGMVMIDLQKAFDTVDHQILCNKLQAMGVSNIKWFQSYLTGRKQLVNVNGTESNLADISCGVPQGSILDLYFFFVMSMTCPLA